MTSCIVLLVREDILTNYNVNNNLFCRYSQRDHAIKFDYKKNKIKTNTLHNFLNIAANLCGISVHTGFQSGFVFLFFLRLLLIKTLDVAVALFYIFATHLGGLQKLQLKEIVSQQCLSVNETFSCTRVKHRNRRGL